MQVHALTFTHFCYLRDDVEVVIDPPLCGCLPRVVHYEHGAAAITAIVVQLPLLLSACCVGKHGRLRGSRPPSVIPSTVAIYC